MSNLLKAGCEWLDMSITGLSISRKKVEREAILWNSDLIIPTSMLFLPCF